jgi:hypothetical protein
MEVIRALTKQEIANTIYDWFFVKKNPRAMTGNRCVYRTGKGEKCAVGCCIPDDLYIGLIEGFTALDFFWLEEQERHPNIQKIANLLGKENADFLSQLQEWHDCDFQNTDCLVEIFDSFAIDISNMPLLLSQQ